MLRGIVVSFLVSSSALGATPSLKNIQKEIFAELQRPIRGNFDALFDRWQKKYSVQAVPVLLQAARSQFQKDPSRYLALMGAAKLGGSATEPEIRHFLKDRSWMMRSGALRALSGMSRDKRTGAATLPLLKDKALVVRLEAVHTVRKLWPQGSEEALIGTLMDRRNFHGGKAQWVPQAALAALSANSRSKNRASARKLLPILKKPLDRALLPDVIRTLEHWTGKELARGQNLTRKVQAWQRDLHPSS